MKKTKTLFTSKKIKSLADSIFFLRENDAEDNTEGPSWKFRRKLIFGGYRLGFAMVIFGMFTFFYDTQVSIQMVIGGVSLISIILGAYTATATWQDVRFNNYGGYGTYGGYDHYGYSNNLGYSQNYGHDQNYGGYY